MSHAESRSHALSPTATQPLKDALKVEAPHDTVKSESPKPPVAVARPAEAHPPRRKAWWLWVSALLVVGACGGGLWWWLGRSAKPALAPKAETAPEPLPPEVEIKVQEANKGDVHAMHALAIWHYYGIYVPKNRERGLAWYRKAAAAGSESARQELAQIEGR